MKPCLLFLLLLFSLIITPSAQARTALVIGNDDYQEHYFDKLNLAVRDARLLRDKLLTLGFEVIEKENLNKAQTLAALNEFSDKLADDKEVGLFYFAGHGIQHEGVNYLIPLKAHIDRTSDAITEAINADLILNRMQTSQAANKINIFILDACRDNNLPNRGSAQGLATIARENTFIAYSTQPNKIADDGTFMEALAKRISEPVDLTAMFMKVIEDVQHESKGNQTPSFYYGLKELFYFNAQTAIVPVKPMAVTPAVVSTPPSPVINETRPPATPPAFVERITAASAQPSTPPTHVVNETKTPATPLALSRHAYEPEMVTVSGGAMGDFTLGKTEITKAQFKAFVDATDYQTDAEKGDGCWDSGSNRTDFIRDKSFNWRNVSFPQDDDHPVVCVSWNDAMAYVNWLKHQTGKSYALPTEEQWIYAASGGKTKIYSWGDSKNDACQYANVASFDAVANFFGWSADWSGFNCYDGFAFTAPVGHFTATAFGLYDMTGNVSEWTFSQMLRGGSWLSFPTDARLAERFNLSADNSYDNLGFRVCCVSSIMNTGR